MVLHGDEAGPSVKVRKVKRFGKLPGIHRRSADIARLTCLDHVMQGFESLLYRRFVIPAMNLVQINVIGLQTAKTVVYLTEDRLSRKSAPVRPLPHDSMDFRGNHDSITLCIA